MDGSGSIGQVLAVAAAGGFELGTDGPLVIVVRVDGSPKWRPSGIPAVARMRFADRCGSHTAVGGAR
jgi:hypothetical protein